eukprot:2929186-Rhodomonas_salina.2
MEADPLNWRPRRLRRFPPSAPRRFGRNWRAFSPTRLRRSSWSRPPARSRLGHRGTNAWPDKGGMGPGWVGWGPGRRERGVREEMRCVVRAVGA